MRTLILCLLVFTCSLTAEQTLFDSEGFKGGGFGGPTFKYTVLDGQSAMLVGGRGAFVMNSLVAIGGGGCAIVTEVDAKPTAPIDYPFLSIAYGGLNIDIIILSDEILHFTVGSAFSWGVLAFNRDFLDGNDDWDDDDDPFSPEKDAFFAFIPEVNAELNVTHFFRLNLGVGYRFASGVDLSGYKNSDISGIEAGLFLKFGGNM